MRNRDSIIRNLELMESKLNTLKTIVNKQEPIETYLSVINSVLELTDSTISYIENEDLTPNELNHR